MAFKNIIIKGKSHGTIEGTGTAGGTITPGYLVNLSDKTAVVADDRAAQNVEKAFAIENDGIGDDIDENYASGDTMRFVLCQTGVEIFALVAALATAVTAGAALESAGDGTLRLHTVLSTGSIYTNAIVAFAEEAVDNSAGTAEARIQVRVA